MDTPEHEPEGALSRFMRKLNTDERASIGYSVLSKCVHVRDLPSMATDNVIRCLQLYMEAAKADIDGDGSRPFKEEDAMNDSFKRHNERATTPRDTKAAGLCASVPGADMIPIHVSAASRASTQVHPSGASNAPSAKLAAQPDEISRLASGLVRRTTYAVRPVVDLTADQLARLKIDRVGGTILEPRGEANMVRTHTHTHAVCASIVREHTTQARARAHTGDPRATCPRD
jgi:hypothetical protein